MATYTTDLPDHEYRASKRLSCSALMKFSKGCDGDMVPQKAAEFGRAFHSFMEGRPQDVISVRGKTDKAVKRGSKVHEALQDIISPNQVLVSPSELGKLHEMLAACLANPDTKRCYEAQGDCEASIAWDAVGDWRQPQEMKSRIDKVVLEGGRPVAIIDYKTTSCTTPEDYEVAAIKYGYAVPAWAYGESVRLAFDLDVAPPFIHSIHSKIPPYPTWTKRFTATELAYGRELFAAMMRHYQAMEKTHEQQRKAESVVGAA